ncbi:hypothetical protein BDW22DRAFT_799321 [Trametopsis cervina]|nr:hypothetical protein BDW22DRAFT_799321 [Trametopsis cervina]
MNHLPFELGLFVAAFAQAARARLSVRDVQDIATSCTGKYASLNTDGSSPGTVYSEVKQPCEKLTETVVAQSACYCNLASYNLRQAQYYCQQDEPETWAQWADIYRCSNSSAPPPTPAYSITGLPPWATQALTVDGQFDVDGALATSTGGSGGWSPIQIALPIIVGLIVAVVGTVLFLLYRRRKQRETGRYSDRYGQAKDKPWRRANLQGPRRMFGLFPDRLKVKHKSTRESAWAIDGMPMGDFGEKTSSPRNDISDFPSDMLPPRAPPASRRHSRTESESSLISGSSRKSSQSFLSQIASKFSNLSLSRAYQSGTTKGRDYKRVRVVHQPPDSRFDVDGAPMRPQVRLGQLDQSSLREEEEEEDAEEQKDRQDSFPSVLDIRRQPSPIDSRHATRDDSGPLTLGSTTRGTRRPPESEFSLGTTDLMTPTVTDSPVSQGPSGVCLHYSCHCMQCANRRLSLFNVFVASKLNAGLARLASASSESLRTDGGARRTSIWATAPE